MNTALPTPLAGPRNVENIESVATFKLATCFHCGLPVDSTTTFGVCWHGQYQPMCCAGCEAVATMIIDSGMDDFYRHRTGYSTKPIDALPIKTSFAASDDDDDDNDSVISIARKVATLKPVSLYLTNLTCAACVWLAENTLKRIAGVRDVEVNFTTRSVRLQSNHPDTHVFIQALHRVGLTAEQVGDANRDANHQRRRREQLMNFGVASLSMMQVMMLTVPLYFASSDDISIDARHLMGWAAWLMTLPALLFSARPIFTAAWRGLSIAHIGMDLPVATALALTFLASSWALITHQGHLYFDAITMFIFLLLGARWIESTTRDRAIARIERMANQKPMTVSRLIDFPNSEANEWVDSQSLCTNQIIAIEQGALIPADGTILRGESEVDESLMTGESIPVTKRVGDNVVGGTLNMFGVIVMQITAVGKHSVLARLANLVDSALLARPTFHGVPEKVARYLAPLTLLLAFCGALIWAFIDPTRSLDVAVAVLAVTCPCAFALAAPTAAAAALGAMAERGMLVVRGHVLETLATATDVVFDKTGTITTGQWRLIDISGKQTERGFYLAVCGALESGAIHPVARAIQRELAKPQDNAIPIYQALVATTLTQIAGSGVEGVINGQQYRFGTAAFAMGDSNTPSFNGNATNSNTAVVLSIRSDQQWIHLATLRFADAIRPHVALTIAKLEAAGLNVHLLSGDEASVVKAVAIACAISADRVRARQSAANKRDYVLALQAQGRQVVAIGDGMNDAPMLAAANAGIGLATGASLTRLSSDAVLDEGKQQLFICIGDAFARARYAQTITRQNLGWAFAYNAIALPLALSALVTPFIAAVGMAASSLVVVINATRLWSWNRSGS